MCGLELPIDVVQRARRGFVADRGPDRLAADHALQVKASHQPRHSAAGNIVALTLELPPDFAPARDTEVLLYHPPAEAEERYYATLDQPAMAA